MFSFLGYGVLYDCIRILNFLVSGYFNVYFDKISYLFKLPTVLLTYSFLARIMLKFMEVSGYSIKKYIHIRIFFVGMSIILSFLNLFTFYQSYFYDLFGFYMFMVNPILRIIIYSLYTPFFLFLGINGIKLLSEIKNKGLKRRITFMFTFFGILILGRLYNLGYFFPFSNYISTYIIDFLIVSISLFCLCVFAIKNPEMLQSISTYFSVKSIYIIQKNGTLIFDHDFKEEIYQDAVSPRQILIGGFIYAVNKGLKSFFDFTGEINVINFGNIIVLIKHSEHIFAILSASENTPIIQQKLSLLIEKFETLYENELENWTGSSVFKSEDIKSMIYGIFR
ncbi:MAG: hypothetical protein ACFFDN_39655 [Candidatus Hodarchaeota archaeon]